MKMEFDVSQLSNKERVHIANFITSWPDQFVPVEYDEEENKILQAEQDRDMKVSPAFDNDNPDVVEVSPFIPKPPTAAHSFADAAASMIAQGGIPETTSATLIVPPPPVVSSAPPVPTAAQATGNPVALDKHGLPWDSRIHASTKTFIADGSWKLRRGVEPEQVRIVTEELTKLMRIPVTVESLHTITPTPTPSVHENSVHFTGHNMMVTSTPEIPPGYAPLSETTDANIVITPPPVPVDIVKPVSLTELIGRMSAAIAAGKLTQAQVGAACNKYGVSEFALLSSRPDLLPLIDGEMKALGV